MRVISKSTAAAAILSMSFIALASGPDPDPEAAEHAYMTTVFSPVLGEDCELLLPGFRARLDPAMTAWEARNASAIAAGREAQRAKLRPGQTLESHEAHMRKILSTSMLIFPPEEKKARCLEKLQRLGTEAAQAAGPDSPSTSALRRG